MTHLRQAMLDELQRRNYAKTTIQYNSPCSSASRDSRLTLHERDTPSPPSNRRAQLRSGDACLRALGAATAAPIIAPHSVRFRI